MRRNSLIFFIRFKQQRDSVSHIPLPVNASFEGLLKGKKIQRKKKTTIPVLDSIDACYTLCFTFIRFLPRPASQSSARWTKLLLRYLWWTAICCLSCWITDTLSGRHSDELWELKTFFKKKCMMHVIQVVVWPRWLLSPIPVVISAGFCCLHSMTALQRRGRAIDGWAKAAAKYIYFVTVL